MASTRAVLRWNLALSAAARQAQWWRALSLLRGVRESELQPDLVTLNTAVRACTRGSRWQRALQLLKETEALQLQPDQVSFTSLLGFQSDAGAWLRALAVLHALEAALGTADGHALNAALNACAGSGHWAAALALLLRLKGKARAVGLSTAMAAAVKVQRWDVALRLLPTEEWGQMDGVLLATCLRVCRAGHVWHLGLRLLQGAARADAAVFNSAISMCGDAAQWQIALNLLGGARKRGIMDTIGCNAAMTACDKGLAWPQALLVFGMAQRRDAISYGAALSACAAAQQWVHAVALLRHGLRRNLCLSEQAWSALLTACGTQWELALALADEGRGPRWDLTCHNSLLQVLARGGAQWRHVLRLLSAISQGERQILRPNAVTWDAAYVACEAAGHLPPLPRLQKRLCRFTEQFRGDELEGAKWPLQAGLGLALWARGRLQRRPDSNEPWGPGFFSEGSSQLQGIKARDDRSLTMSCLVCAACLPRYMSFWPCSVTRLKIMPHL
ncbi:unnamed protein product [Effrenium voratum]|nr:unnamed protein product [Effrenium voratum]